MPLYELSRRWVLLHYVRAGEYELNAHEKAEDDDEHGSGGAADLAFCVKRKIMAVDLHLFLFERRLNRHTPI